ncbi:MAG: type 1 glutamine amidotransferase domain-containing protein [Desulfobulbaceae bacterium]|nr:type 1 glutamine amidotransferase domain-containing protein [Desulfobulbaceae bacterium]
MAKIAILITDMFEDIEYTSPEAAFRKAGHEVVRVGLQSNVVVRGKKEGTEVMIEQAVKNSPVDSFDALFIPGGYSPDKLRVDKDAVEFVRQFMQTGKPVFSICHGPQILITAKAVKGRKITGWPSVVQDIINAGAEYLDQEVVVDGNLVSSRSPADLPAFIEACLKKLSAAD